MLKITTNERKESLTPYFRISPYFVVCFDRMGIEIVQARLVYQVILILFHERFDQILYNKKGEGHG